MRGNSWMPGGSATQAVILSGLLLVAGCSDKEHPDGGRRFPGLTTTTSGVVSSSVPPATAPATGDAPAAAPETTTVPRPGTAEALQIVANLYQAVGEVPAPGRSECIANAILDRLTESSLSDIARMSRDQYPPGLANDLNAALDECLPESEFAKLVI